MLLLLAIRFLRILKRFRAAEAALQAQKFPFADATILDVNAARLAEQRFEVTYTRMQLALTAVRQWAQLTMLILLAYSATELTDLLKGFSASKMVTVSVLSGSLARILPVWAAGL